MKWMRGYVSWLAVLAALTAFTAPAFAQTQTSTITGRATDESGGALPGVTVSITSPNLIGGARTAVTDEQGVYRFTLLPGGTYVVKFELPGFNTLNIEGVSVAAGATMTINGKLTVASLQETVTVTSQAPTIDLESSKVAVNWDQQKLDEIPYSRSLTGLVALIPGLYATSLDVGGSKFGTGSGPAARTFGRAGGGVVSYDGMIWDQTYGDFGTYEEAQITTAAKGADSMNPGLTMNLIVKSGSNTFKGLGSANYQNGRLPEQQRHAGTARQGLRAGRQQVHVVEGFLRRSRRPDPQRPAVVLRQPPRRRVRQLHPRLHPALGSRAGRVLHEAAGSDRQDHLPGDAEQQDRGHVPGRPQVAAVSHGEPLRPARIDAEPGLDGRWSARRSSGCRSSSPRATFDASLQRGGYWWPDIPWTTDVRKTDLATNNGPTRGAFLETDRDPRRWQYGAHLHLLRRAVGPQSRAEDRVSRLAQHERDREHRLPEPAAVPLSQPRGRCRTATKRTTTTAASRVRTRCWSTTTRTRRRRASGTTRRYFNDKITVSRKFTLNVGVRLRPLFQLPAGAGQPGHRPVRDARTSSPYQGEDNYPIYSTFVPRVSAVYDLTGEGRVAVRASYGRYVGGSSGASANPGPGATDVNPNAIITRTYSSWNGEHSVHPNRRTATLTSTSGGGTQPLDRSGSQGAVRRRIHRRPRPRV